jgi:hypothetical protein
VTRLLSAIALASACSLVGCATYADRTAHGRSAVAAASYDEAIDAFNAELGVGDRDELPTKSGSESALVLLERGMVSQAQGYYESSARDLGESDQRLEVLDITTNVGGELGKYLYSDSAADYRATPVEKLALNTMNMLNYLALGDLAGARVEAKRFTVMRDYLDENHPDESHGVAGAYLAGFVFERLGDANEALRYYDEALAAGDIVHLAPAIHRLAQLNSYRGSHLSAFLERHPMSGDVPRRLPKELLTVVSLGRVPSKRAERIPIGAAVGIAGAEISGDEDFFGYAVMKFVVYPELEPTVPHFTGAAVTIDGQATSLELASDFAHEFTREYENAKPKIIAAAISRMIARAAAAEGAREAGKQTSGDAALIGWIAALVTEAALVAIDKPDTRSWSLLPGQIYVSRTVLETGIHDIEIVLHGQEDETHQRQVEIGKSGFAAVVVTPLR